MISGPLFQLQLPTALKNELKANDFCSSWLAAIFSSSHNRCRVAWIRLSGLF
jgi:hypothetical protein